MSDSRLRELERRARQTGAVEDQAAVLTERLRRALPCEACGGRGETWAVDPAGDDDSPAAFRCALCAGTGSTLYARVELAAYCGAGAAARALQPFPDDQRTASGHPTACHPCMALDHRNYTFDASGSWHCLKHAHEHPDLAMWVQGLSRWGPPAMVRAAIAAAPVGLAAWDARAQAPVLSRGYLLRKARLATEAARVWVACPCDEHWRAWAAIGLAPCAPWTADGPAGQWQRILWCAQEAGEAPVRDAIRAALTTWALAEPTPCGRPDADPRMGPCYAPRGHEGPHRYTGEIVRPGATYADWERDDREWRAGLAGGP